MNAQKIISLQAAIEIKKDKSAIIVANSPSGSVVLEVSSDKAFKNLTDSCFLIFEKYLKPTSLGIEGKVLQATHKHKVIFHENPVAPFVYQFYQVLKPESITYNGSDDPNECVESVDFGVRINTHKGGQFFHIPYRIFKEISQIDRTEIYRIQVSFSNQETHENESGENGAGSVIRIIGAEDEIVLYDHFKSLEE